MKQLLITVPSERAFKILNGLQTLELRTYVPKNYQGWVNLCVAKKEPKLCSLTFVGRKFYMLKDQIAHFTFFSDVADEDLNFLNGKVVARFWFDEYEEYGNTDLYSYTYMHRIEKLLKNACITSDKLYGYIKKVKPEEETKYRKYHPFYAWHIKNLEIFDKPKELRVFYRGEYQGVAKAPQKFMYVWSDEE